MQVGVISKETLRSFVETLVADTYFFDKNRFYYKFHHINRTCNLQRAIKYYHYISYNIHIKLKTQMHVRAHITGFLCCDPSVSSSGE